MKHENNKIKILVVDDEPVNLEVISEYLNLDQYEVSTMESSVEASKVIEQNPDKFDIILLDRMMPDMDGMELLENIKKTPKLRHIPVIMQTAMAASEDIKDGIRAGAFYYLTKPFEEDMLLSIVEAASNDVIQQRIIKKDLESSRPGYGMIESCTIKVKTLDEAKTAALYLSNLYPDPERVYFGLNELIVNGIEHGNLGIGYSKKTELLMSGSWRDEVEKRLAMSGNEDKQVIIRYYKNNEDIKLYIKDEGNGFEWDKYMEIAPERATDNHGRGIAISNLMSFDEMSYIGEGNEVSCTILLGEEAEAAHSATG